MATEKCTICGKPTEEICRCGTCKSTCYCSATCQKIDWPLHKLLCGKFAAFVEAGPPVDTEVDERAISSTYKLAIMFPEKSKFPELVWVKCLTVSDYDTGYEDEKFDPAMHSYQNIYEGFGNQIIYPRAMPSTRHGHQMEIFMGDNSLGDCEPNMCFGFLNAGYQEVELGVHRIARSRFAGNVVTVSCEAKRVKRGEYAIKRTYYYDITLADLRYAFEFMSERNTIFESEKPNKYYIRTPNQWMKAVKISCRGDMVFMGKHKYREVAVRRYHSIFHDEGKSNISNIPKQMGFALRVKELDIDRSWYHKRSNAQLDPCSNAESARLMLDMDVSNTGGRWGSVSANFENCFGLSTLVVRKDRKDLTTHQVEALVNYIKVVVLQSIGEAGPIDDQQSNLQLRQHVVDSVLLSSKFRDFFNTLKQKKIEAGDDSWAGAVFPGDI